MPAAMKVAKKPAAAMKKPAAANAAAHPHAANVAPPPAANVAPPTANGTVSQYPGNINDPLAANELEIFESSPRAPNPTVG